MKKICFLLMALFSTLTAFPDSFPSIANQDIDLSTGRLAYRDEGQGEVLLCLHAVGHSSKDFQSLYDRLPLERYRIIAVDFPSHGRSAKAPSPISATFFQSITQEFIERMALDRITIIGNSIGGATGLRIAAESDKVRALVLSNPGGLDKGGLLAPIFLNRKIAFFKKGRDQKPRFQKAFENYYRQVWPAEAASARRVEITADAYALAPGLVEAWESFKRKEEDLRPLIEQVKVPVLFAWCMKDKAIRFGRNAKAIGAFAQAEVVKYKGAGHTPYVECPAAFVRDFEAFMERL